MDIVKAVINLKEGTLQLEGPQEFVEKYLDQYDSIIKNWKTFFQLSPKEVEGEVEEASSKRKRTRITKPKGTSSCMGRIRNLIDENYFKDPRTSTEVMNWLKEQKGALYDSSPITAALNQFIKSSKLRRIKEGKGPYKYCNP